MKKININILVCLIIIIGNISLANNLNNLLFNPQEKYEGTLHEGFDGEVDKIIPLPSQKILVFGKFKNFGNQYTNQIALLNQDGSLDQNFQLCRSEYSIFDNEIKDVVVWKNKIYVVGGFTKYQNIELDHIGCFNLNGVIDTTYFKRGNVLYNDFSSIINVITDTINGEENLLLIGIVKATSNRKILKVDLKNKNVNNT